MTTEESKPEPRYQEGQTLYGTRADGTEFEGTAASVSEPYYEGCEWLYNLEKFENYEMKNEWFSESRVSTLRMVDRMRFIEDQLGIKH